MKTYLPAFLLILLAALCACSKEADNTAAVEKASTAAEKWIALVDAGAYAESWNEASSLFKANVTAEEWEGAMQSLRAPLGRVIVRRMKTAEYKTSLPGAPDGEYVVIQFDTKFENKSAAVETITPMLDKDGTWRVSGYFIK